MYSEPFQEDISDRLLVRIFVSLGIQEITIASVFCNAAFVIDTQVQMTQILKLFQRKQN